MWLPFSGQTQSLSLAVLLSGPEVHGSRGLWMGKCQLPYIQVPPFVFIPWLPCQTASLCCRSPIRPLTEGLASEFLGHSLGFVLPLLWHD